MKKIITCCIAILLCSSLNAQLEENNIQIEIDSTKTEYFDLDANENEVIVKKEIRSIEKEEILDDENGRILKYKIITTDDKGKKKVLKWEGNDESEIPDEIKAILEEEKTLAKEGSEDVQIEVEQEIQKKVRIKKMDGNEESIMEFESDRDGSFDPEIQEMLEEHGIDLEELEQSMNEENKDKFAEKKIRVKVIKEEKEVSSDNDWSDRIQKNDSEVQVEKEVEIKLEENTTPEKPKRKAQLGVMIEDHPDGVIVTNIVSNSSAEEAGIITGEIITSVNGTEIKSTEELIQMVSEFFAGDKITIGTLNEGAIVERDVILKQRTPRTWDEVMGKN